MRLEMEKQEARFGWLDGENERLRGIVEQRAGDMADPADRPAAQSLVTSRPAPVTEPPRTLTPNRAQRRQAEKRSRRRW